MQTVSNVLHISLAYIILKPAFNFTNRTICMYVCVRVVHEDENMINIVDTHNNSWVMHIGVSVIIDNVSYISLCLCIYTILHVYLYEYYIHVPLEMREICLSVTNIVPYFNCSTI